MTHDRSTSTLDPMGTASTGSTSGQERHPLAETGREAGERAGRLAERGTDIGFQQADKGLRQAASGVETVADSIRRVSTDIQTEQPQVAEIAQTAADRAEDLARYLRETDVRQMISSVESFARRQPLLFLGGAFVAGVAASRLIKAASGGNSNSSSQATRRDEWQGYATPQGYGGIGQGDGQGDGVGSELAGSFMATGPGSRDRADGSGTAEGL